MSSVTTNPEESTPGGLVAAPAVKIPTKRRIRWNSSQISGLIGGLLLLSLILMAVFAPYLTPYDPDKRAGAPFESPSQKHLLGTNDIGRDLLTEMMYGARNSLVVGIVAAIVAMVIGTTVGLLAGYYPKVVGQLLMRGVDIILVLPFFPLLIILAAYIGQSLINTTVIIGFLIWAGTARIIRSYVLTITQQDYVLYAKTVGTSDIEIIFRHILPQVLLLAVGQFVQATSVGILLEAALSFIGLGDPTQKSWGTILYWAQVRGIFMSPAWKWWALPAGLLISLAALSFALIGFALEMKIDPRLRMGKKL
jgi:peptide/nickel transport system ATP-binding protein/peptide/nickel transport system permease protein